MLKDLFWLPFGVVRAGLRTVWGFQGWKLGKAGFGEASHRVHSWSSHFVQGKQENSCNSRSSSPTGRLAALAANLLFLGTIWSSSSNFYNWKGFGVKALEGPLFLILSSLPAKGLLTSPPICGPFSEVRWLATRDRIFCSSCSLTGECPSLWGLQFILLYFRQEAKNVYFYVDSTIYLINSLRCWSFNVIFMDYF